MPQSSRHENRHVLVVSPDTSFIDKVVNMLADPRLDPRTDPAEVIDLLAREPFAGLIVDGRMANRMATRVAQAYVLHQPMGRVAILAGPEDVTTLVAFAFRDPRCDLFFHPWDTYAVLNFLRIVREDALTAASVAPSL